MEETAIPLRQPVVLLHQRTVEAHGLPRLVRMIGVTVAVAIIVMMIMAVIVGMAPDLHVFTAQTASTFFAHIKIVPLR